jgi:FkbM family methyltransferase
VRLSFTVCYVHPLVAALRLPLSLIPDRAEVRIVFGPQRGARWIVGSGNHVCWLGLYESRKQLALKRTVSRGSVFYDIGAHVGFHTLLASRLVGSSGRVCAFEPLPRNLRYLHEHVRLNGAANVQVIEAAVSDRAGFEAFAERGTYMGGLQESGALAVRTIAIDPLVDAGTICSPDYVKVDVEGGEMRALEGMRRTLVRSRPLVFLATHSAALHRDCIQFLGDLDYHVTALTGGDIWRTDELVAQYPHRTKSGRG